MNAPRQQEGGYVAAPAAGAAATAGLALAATQTASDRLELTRAALRLAMAGHPAPQRDGAATASPLSGLLHTLRELPGGSAVMEVLAQWWERQPLRAGLQVAGGALRDLAGPAAARSPLALVLGAMVGGALLAGLKPWCWLPRTLMFAGLVPQLASRLIAAVPLETWLDAMTRRAAPPKAATSDPRADPSAGAS